MTFGLGVYGLGLLAGLLSTLSPCVLPILPVLLCSALAVHPHAPLALAAGLALSYAVIGTLVAWAGVAIGIDASLFRDAGAVLLAGFGLVLMSSRLQRGFAVAMSGIGDVGHRFLAGLNPVGLSGQFVIGLALGVVWSPCVGPTLGAAILLAGQGRQLPQAALLMLVFGCGAALPVVGLAYLSRAAMTKARGNLLRAGGMGKIVFGAIMVALAVLILSGADRQLETWLLQVSPAWLTAVTTRF